MKLLNIVVFLLQYVVMTVIKVYSIVIAVPVCAMMGIQGLPVTQTLMNVSVIHPSVKEGPYVTTLMEVLTAHVQIHAWATVMLVAAVHVQEEEHVVVMV